MNTQKIGKVQITILPLAFFLLRPLQYSHGFAKLTAFISSYVKNVSALTGIIERR